MENENQSCANKLPELCMYSNLLPGLFIGMSAKWLYLQCQVVSVKKGGKVFFFSVENHDADCFIWVLGVGMPLNSF